MVGVFILRKKRPDLPRPYRHLGLSGDAGRLHPGGPVRARQHAGQELLELVRRPGLHRPRRPGLSLLE
ncbi:MAG: hypothetical protein MZV64_52690 [Ignavibacteriales bacterium]|nr:hypothetical protein [Ignavibacteriales bacterium]